MSAIRKLICQWRVSRASPSGLQVWFDPRTETIRLYSVEPPGTPGVEDFGEGDDSNEKSAPDPSDEQVFVQEDLPF